MGFTLVELMIVVAVVAILASIAIPSYQDSIRKSRRAQAKADLVELAQRAERFHTVNNTYMGFWATVEAGGQVSPRGSTGTKVYYEFPQPALTANTFLLTATPKNSQTQDARCGTLTLNHLGEKTKSGDAPTLAECW